VTLAALLALGGCTTARMPPTQDRSLYQRLGGKDAITAVVDDAIGNVSADVRINQRFANAGSSALTKNLVELICARTGGPCTYAGRDMSAAHEGMNIRDDEFDALVEDLMKALDKFKVPAQEKAEVAVILGQMKNAITGH
jgi:hemoglobin